jgi:hypothetical protein
LPGEEIIVTNEHGQHIENLVCGSHFAAVHGGERWLRMDQHILMGRDLPALLTSVRSATSGEGDDLFLHWSCKPGMGPCGTSIYRFPRTSSSSCAR